MGRRKNLKPVISTKKLADRTRRNLESADEKIARLKEMEVPNKKQIGTIFSWLVSIGRMKEADLFGSFLNHRNPSVAWKKHYITDRVKRIERAKAHWQRALADYDRTKAAEAAEATRRDTERVLSKATGRRVRFTAS